MMTVMTEILSRESAITALDECFCLEKKICSEDLSGKCDELRGGAKLNMMRNVPISHFNTIIAVCFAMLR